jgi:hypothetical protein
MCSSSSKERALKSREREVAGASYAESREGYREDNTDTLTSMRLSTGLARQHRPCKPAR